MLSSKAIVTKYTSGKKVSNGEFDFTLDKNQKDEQDIAEEIRKAVREKLARRTVLFAPRDRSASVDSDDLTSFKAQFAQECVATKMAMSKEHFLEVHQSPNRNGAVDGTTAPLYRAPSMSTSSFATRKHSFALSLTGVVNHNGKFIYMATGYSDSRHDSAAYKVLACSGSVNGFSLAPLSSLAMQRMP
ncbi:hypothetical protein BG011_000671 [Mortierella polycephala]|uniref:DDE Tnp4 domain-containing protein n=1 Tax=Mortierella polycephala TaxID=41804 RepID=A0A9P6TV70_9FUNG|nr:hypothetical protein BG011_000671 [Mortierella polycephala]